MQQQQEKEKTIGFRLDHDSSLCLRSRVFVWGPFVPINIIILLCDPIRSDLRFPGHRTQVTAWTNFASRSEGFPPVSSLCAHSSSHLLLSMRLRPRRSKHTKEKRGNSYTAICLHTTVKPFWATVVHRTRSQAPS